MLPAARELARAGDRTGAGLEGTELSAPTLGDPESVGRAGNRTSVLHLGHFVSAGLASSLTDIFVRQLGHDTIVASDAGGFDAGGFAGRDGAAVRRPAAAGAGAGTTERI